jgi:hypothetical protein
MNSGKKGLQMQITKEIVDLVKAHDKTYEYSEDSSYYQKGKQERAVIISKLKELGMNDIQAKDEYNAMVKW